MMYVLTKCIYVYIHICAYTHTHLLAGGRSGRLVHARQCCGGLAARLLRLVVYRGALIIRIGFEVYKTIMAIKNPQNSIGHY